jgi:N-acetylneuraminic acid mutarotase
MNRILFISSFILFMATNVLESLAQKELKISWGKPLAIPPATGKPVQYGVAGALIGFSSGQLMVAGGANFEDMVPWRGGTKQYHEVIYLMQTNKQGQSTWKQASALLPQKMGYSACVTWNNRVISLGGENVQGPVQNVYSFSVVDGDVQCTSLTNLPQPVSSGGAALIENTVYLAGGMGLAGGLSSFYSARLDENPLKWEGLPSLPIALSHAVVVSQHDGTETCVYVLGGRNKTGITSTFYPTIWKYSPSKKVWTNVGDITNARGEAVGLSAGTGVAAGQHHIVLFGGDAGIVFNRTERYLDAIANAANEEEKQSLIRQKNEGQESHPGFNRDVWAYNTITGTIRRIGKLPDDAQVTTLAVMCNNTVYIPSGEIRPGIRTARVAKGVIRIKKK